VPLRKESQRGLIALAILCAAGAVTFALTAFLASPGARRARGKDAVAVRVVHPR
jgi:hypothetical protein